jgi:hypothetical protein
VEPCASSNGSLPRNSCFGHRHNQTGTQHEALCKSSITARLSERMRIPCPIWRGWLGRLPLRPSTGASLRCFTHPSQRQIRTSYPTPPVLDPHAPAQTDSKYIAFHEGGFLQVAVSEAPLGDHANAHGNVAGAPDTALRLLGCNQAEAF